MALEVQVDRPDVDCFLFKQPVYDLSSARFPHPPHAESYRTNIGMATCAYFLSKSCWIAHGEFYPAKANCQLGRLLLHVVNFGLCQLNRLRCSSRYPICISGEVKISYSRVIKTTVLLSQNLRSSSASSARAS